VIEYYLNINTNILSQVFYETIVLLIDNDYDTTKIRNIDDFKKIEFNEDHKLYDLIYLINTYVDTLIEFLSSNKFNKHLTFSVIKKAIIDSTYRIEKFEDLNREVMRLSNIHNKGVPKVTSFTV
jgi:uncharacterized protein YlbG (UPF0298 family)